MLTVDSNFKYNQLFRIVGYRIVAPRRNLIFNFTTNSNLTLSAYKNFKDVHDRRINGIVSFSIPYDWKNESIYAEVIAAINDQEFYYSSVEIFIDYKTMFQGVALSLNQFL